MMIFFIDEDEQGLKILAVEPTTYKYLMDKKDGKVDDVTKIITTEVASISKLIVIKLLNSIDYGKFYYPNCYFNKFYRFEQLKSISPYFKI
jgi:hypothetical protein